MKISLNIDKASMLFFASLPPLTFSTPGPIEVDETQLTDDLRKQLVYAWSQGQIILDPPNVLMQNVPGLVHVDTLKSQVVVQPSTKASPVTTSTDPYQGLEKLLTKQLAVIKKKIPTLSVSQLRQLKELEESGKKRKSLLLPIQTILDTHVKQVQAITPADGLQETKEDLKPYSTIVSDVVESVVETITIPTTE